MSYRGRIVLAVLWVLSLVLVSEWRAGAQFAPGGEVRFVQQKNINGVVTGHLMANIGGAWVPVDVGSSTGGTLVPLAK